MLDWMESYEPFKARFAGKRPRIKPDLSGLMSFEGAHEDRDHQRMVLCLLAIYRLWRLRQSGDLRSPVQGLAALETWERDIAPLGAITPQTLLVVVQTVLGSLGSPAVSLCKFHSYTSRRSALSAAWNASWDMTFLRQVRDSELGMNIYDGQALPTLLFTFDKHLAATSDEISGLISRTWAGDSRIHGAYVDPRINLRREVVGDKRVMDGLDEWLAAARSRQYDRINSVPVGDAEELDLRIDRALSDLRLVDPT